MSNWRWATWLVVAWTVLMAVVMVLVIYPAVPDLPSYNPPHDGDTAAYQAGTAFGMALIYWGLGFIVLGPIWFFTRKRVMCPVCGNKVSPKAARCSRCGYIPGMAVPSSMPQPGWPPPPPAGWPPPQGAQPAWPPPPPGAQPPAWPPQPPGPPDPPSGG